MSRISFLSRRHHSRNAAWLVARSFGRRGDGNQFIGVLPDLRLAFERSNLARRVV